ncbi:hypothetical protein [Thermoplasma volcanium GSS1]|uniref:HTH marR-type domain-containing protein n=1 Tax=Thermoplasma volcanium (strain ATCC 51530 / DSM 4299 / JCM 9571 / NBRC 15438 / GSS1) TaxID=273116 RepID=Q97B55_THEVO|nr:MarR family transcriptional regulator [Thermoplasma volcanium]BAB59745.1 hypothetical protein [Thermoplasma volcanium GSS1]
MSLRDVLLRELKRARGLGIDQFQIEEMMGFSKSTVSEALKDLEEKGIIKRRTIGGKIKHVWLAEYYPYYDEKLLRIGCLRSTEYVKFVSVAKNYSESKGIDLIVRFYDDAISLMNDLSQGLLEFALAPIFTEIIYSISNRNSIILGAVASGGSGVYKNVNCNCGKILTSESSSMMILAREFAKTRKISEIAIFKDPRRAIKDYESFKAEYIVIWEPYASKIMGEKMASFSDVLDSFPCCGISVSENNRENRTLIEIVRLYKRSRFTAREDVIDIFAKSTSVSPKTAKASLENYIWDIKFYRSDLKKYLEFIGYPPIEEIIEKIYEEV